jgi:simple sugar transport system permease protein
VWNIGAEGQYLLGAISCGGLALWITNGGVEMSRWVFFPLAVLAGALGGAAWAGIVALLRDRFNANEILVSLMLVYVADLLLSWLVFGPWKDPQGFNFPQTVTFAPQTELPRVVRGMRLHWGSAVALVAAVLMWLFMFRTYRGIQLQVGGPAPAAARYAGFSARVAVWTTLLISGALAGVAGAFEVAGPMGQLTPHVASGYGFTGIIVAFVGRLHPLGAILGSVVLSAFVIGGELAQSRVGLPSALTGVFQGMLLLSLLACDTLIHNRLRLAPRALRPIPGRNKVAA